MKENVAKILRNWGFTVKQIEENYDRKTPDLLVKNNSEKYLVEVKTRGKNEPYPAGKEEESFEIIKRRFSRSAAQLNDCREEVDFRITWFSLVGLDCAFRIVSQIVPALYGIEINESENFDIKTLVPDDLYFRRAIFHPVSGLRYPLDAVIIQDVSKFYFCVNNRSENYNKLKNSHIYKFCNRNFTVIPPRHPEFCSRI